MEQQPKNLDWVKLWHGRGTHVAISDTNGILLTLVDQYSEDVLSNLLGAIEQLANIPHQAFITNKVFIGICETLDPYISHEAFKQTRKIAAELSHPSESYVVLGRSHRAYHLISMKIDEDEELPPIKDFIVLEIGLSFPRSLN